MQGKDLSKRRVSEGARVIVVGAGFAGLAAARDLQRYGYTVTILEARDRIGGRVHTDDSFGFPIDLGAAWFHGGMGNPLKSVAEWVGVDTRETHYDNMVIYGEFGVQINAEDLNSYILTAWVLLFSVFPWLMATAHRQGWVNKSPDFLGVLDRAIRWCPIDRYKITLRVLRNAEESGNAASADGLSFARQFIRSKTCAAGTIPKGERLVIAGMTSLIKQLTAGLTIRTGEVVESVKYKNGSVELVTAKDVYQAEAAVLTLPIGVLKAGKVTFDPGLPKSHVEAIRRLEMGVFNKVILEFPDVVWPRTRDFLAIATRDPVVPFFLNLHAYVQRPILVGIAGGSFGKKIEEWSQTQVVDHVMDDLRKSLGKNIPEPTRVLVTHWGADPYALGSYSTLPPVANGLEAEALSQPIRDTLFFAGEATHPSDPSTVHGAYWSGQRAAAQIAGLVE